MGRATQAIKDLSDGDEVTVVFETGGEVSGTVHNSDVFFEDGKQYWRRQLSEDGVGDWVLRYHEGLRSVECFREGFDEEEAVATIVEDYEVDSISTNE